VRHTPSWPDLRDRWPNSEASRFVDAGAQRWHVQVVGSGPPLLLVHGIGAATHTWGTLAPRLAKRFTVVAPDLPGHGFTISPRTDRLSLDGFAEELSALLRALELVPTIGVGHAAGTAVLLRMALTSGTSLRSVVGINAALYPPRSQLWTLFAPAAKVAVKSAQVAELGARLASGSMEDALLRSTGSIITDEQMALYSVFLRSRRHMGAMMTLLGAWGHAALERDLPGLTVPVTLGVALDDNWVPPRDAERLARRIPRSRVVEIARAGHFAHEERAPVAENIVIEAAVESGVLPSR